MRNEIDEVNEVKIKCPNCGSDDVELVSPPSASGTDTLDLIECNNCGYGTEDF